VPLLAADLRARRGDNLEHGIWQRSLERRRFIPWRAHPSAAHIALAQSAFAIPISLSIAPLFGLSCIVVMAVAYRKYSRALRR
jgi:hypothetical protein